MQTDVAQHAAKAFGDVVDAVLAGSEPQDPIELARPDGEVDDRSQQNSQHGADVIDADQLARDVVEPGQPALQEIVATFGRDVLMPDGRLNRGKLAGIIFADPVLKSTRLSP